MNYSAYVNCNCYKQGKTVEPPHSAFAQFDLEDGPYLDIPDELLEKDAAQVNQMASEFNEWKSTACDHEGMFLEDEYLGTISAMEHFHNMVKELGGKSKYPILIKYLPTEKAGMLPGKFAAKAREELLLLKIALTTNKSVMLTERHGLADHNKMIEQLKLLAKASIISGNPINWTSQ